jgi:xylulokinase
MLLTVDLGTSATKAVLWDHDGPVAMGRAELPTFHPEPGFAEQDAEDWWSSMLDACAQVRAQAEKHFLELTAIGFSTARETFVPVRADGHALGRALLWSDRRAGPEAAQLSAAAGGVDALRELTGIMVDAGSAVAKVAWLRAHQPERLRRARWLLGPRDFVFRRLTGEVATDPTFAGRSGFYDHHGAPAPETAAGVEALLPPVLPSTTSMPLADTEAGLPAGTTVVLGGGDRQCEVLGTGASANIPMVSWGTTANVSLPTTTVPSPLPSGLVASRGAIGGHLLEAGLSASGAALAWLQRLTGLDQLALVDAAAKSEAGARGVVALPWLNGARAPWWRPGARAAFLNVTPAHGPGDLARALYEAVAYDVARSLQALSSVHQRGTPASAAERGSLAATGGGVAGPLWVQVLAAVTGRPVILRRSGEAASAGACLLTGQAVGAPHELDRINPVVATTRPDASLAKRYRDLRPLVDRVAEGVLALDLSEWSTGWT